MPGRYIESFRPVGRKNSLFAEPKRFAHNGLVGRFESFQLITVWLEFESFQLITVWLEVRVLPAHNGLVGGSSPTGPTTQSYATGDFLKVYERPRIGGGLCDGSFSETASLQSAGRFCAFFSGPEIPFPGNGDRERQRLGSNAG